MDTTTFKAENIISAIDSCFVVLVLVFFLLIVFECLYFSLFMQNMICLCTRSLYSAVYLLKGHMVAMGERRATQTYQL